VRDNGAGFDMAYANKLFGAFSSACTSGNEYQGTGIAGDGAADHPPARRPDLGRCQAGQGAAFYFTLESDGVEKARPRHGGGPGLMADAASSLIADPIIESGAIEKEGGAMSRNDHGR